MLNCSYKIVLIKIIKVNFSKRYVSPVLTSKPRQKMRPRTFVHTELMSLEVPKWEAERFLYKKSAYFPKFWNLTMAIYSWVNCPHCVQISCQELSPLPSYLHFKFKTSQTIMDKRSVDFSETSYYFIRLFPATTKWRMHQCPWLSTADFSHAKLAKSERTMCLILPKTLPALNKCQLSLRLSSLPPLRLFYLKEGHPYVFPYPLSTQAKAAPVY